MGSLIEINDTLRLTKEQGFPAELAISEHLQKPYKLAALRDKIFEFKAKEKIRVYQQPPVRNFLVEDLGGKWLYWGLCSVVEVKHDYINGITSGRYKIIRMNSPEEMKQAFELIDYRPELSYFTN